MDYKQIKINLIELKNTIENLTNPAKLDVEKIYIITQNRDGVAMNGTVVFRDKYFEKNYEFNFIYRIDEEYDEVEEEFYNQKTFLKIDNIEYDLPYSFYSRKSFFILMKETFPEAEIHHARKIIEIID